MLGHSGAGYLTASDRPRLRRRARTYAGRKEMIFKTRRRKEGEIGRLSSGDSFSAKTNGYFEIPRGKRKGGPRYWPLSNPHYERDYVRVRSLIGTTRRAGVGSGD